MKKVEATLDASLDVDCPDCDRRIDLFDGDDDGIYTPPIFNNDWDRLKDEEVTCPHCGEEFLIEKVEW